MKPRWGDTRGLSRQLAPSYYATLMTGLVKYSSSIVPVTTTFPYLRENSSLARIFLPLQCAKWPRKPALISG